MKRSLLLDALPNAVLCNPRNGYQNYNAAINTLKRTIYTYMGALKPKMGNVNYCSAGQLSPLFNDPYFKTIGLGTRIFLGGGIGYVTWNGTQHNPRVERAESGAPLRPAGTLWVMGDLKQMDPALVGGGFHPRIRLLACRGPRHSHSGFERRYGPYTAISDEAIFTQVVDYGTDYPKGRSRSLAQVSYAQLRSGTIEVNGETVPTVPLSSMVRAREIADTLKSWIVEGTFQLGEPPDAPSPREEPG
jgi:uncharacterized protein (DUF39 family)